MFGSYKAYILSTQKSIDMTVPSTHEHKAKQHHIKIFSNDIFESNASYFFSKLVFDHCSTCLIDPLRHLQSVICAWELP